jgi:hypothetical protein
VQQRLGELQQQAMLDASHACTQHQCVRLHRGDYG